MIDLGAMIMLTFNALKDGLVLERRETRSHPDRFFGRDLESRPLRWRDQMSELHDVEKFQLAEHQICRCCSSNSASSSSDASISIAAPRDPHRRGSAGRPEVHFR